MDYDKKEDSPKFGKTDLKPDSDPSEVPNVFKDQARKEDEEFDLAEMERLQRYVLKK